MNRQATTPGRVAAMVVFALSCFGLLLFLWLSFGGAIPLGPKGYRVTVDFEEATQLSEQADVRISGVPVGKVVATGAAPQGGVRAEIEVTERHAPLPRDVRATLRQKTLLGETYVELTPGDARGPTLPEGGRLPAGQVRPTVELDEVLRALDEPTRRDLKTLLSGLASGVESRGQELSDGLGSLPPAAGRGADVLGVLSAEREALATLVRDSATTFGALGRRRAQVRALVRASDAVLRTTAGRDDELAETLAILPTTLRELRGALRAGSAASADAAPVLRALRPVARLVPPTLRDTTAVLPQLRGLLRDLDPALAAAREGLPAATRTVDTARAAMPALHLTARDLRPVVAYLGVYRHELMATFQNVAAATQATLQNPGAAQALHYLRVLIPVTNEGGVQQARRLPSNRHNAYLRPRGLDDLATGLRSFDCRHLANPQTQPVLGSAPPGCLTHEPWSFDGGPPRAFQRLARDGR